MKLLLIPKATDSIGLARNMKYSWHFLQSVKSHVFSSTRRDLVGPLFTLRNVSKKTTGCAL